MSPCTKSLGTNTTKRDMSRKLRKMEEKVRAYPSTKSEIL
jgi:hypothetical protein